VCGSCAQDRCSGFAYVINYATARAGDACSKTAACRCSSTAQAWPARRHDRGLRQAGPERGFRFRNPNVKGECGCGESSPSEGFGRCAREGCARRGLLRLRAQKALPNQHFHRTKLPQVHDQGKLRGLPRTASHAGANTIEVFEGALANGPRAHPVHRQARRVRAISSARLSPLEKAVSRSSPHACCAVAAQAEPLLRGIPGTHLASGKPRAEILPILMDGERATPPCYIQSSAGARKGLLPAAHKCSESGPHPSSGAALSCVIARLRS